MLELFTNEIPEIKWSNIFVFMQDATWALFFTKTDSYNKNQ